MRIAKKSPYVLPIGLALVLMGAAALIYLAFPGTDVFPGAREARAMMLKETYKLLVQVILVGIVGGLAIKQWEAQRAASADQEAFVQAFRTRVAEAYFHTKRARRLLKARVQREGGTSIAFDVYERHMLDINDQQLAIETVVREVEARSRDFDEFVRIKDDLKRMEAYLRALVREYQYDSPFAWAGANAPVNLASHGCLGEFIVDVDTLEPDKKSLFTEEFARRFADILLALRGEARMNAAILSVVIPALDEEASIAAAIASVRDEADEVLVADGGSADATCARATAAGARVVAAPRGRGPQQIEGARQARGDWIVFLHADTRLAAGWSHVLRAAPPEVVLVAFRFAVDSPLRAFRLMELGTRLRCALIRLPYGDQALSVRRAAYDAAGGFAPLPLMEDVDLVRRLRAQGALVMSPLRALTSGRRWEKRSLLRGTLRNWTTMALYALGVSPDRLARRYERLSR